jgi:cellulose synthase/poly-beta-1,6-N-acetylglucosamine synthase-like glycosyltransferase
MTDTALCSTIYPAVLPFVSPWLASVLAQTDSDFDLWLAVDGVDDEVLQPLLTEIPVRLVRAVPGSTPAEVRSVLFGRLVEGYEVIVMVDADDVLAPTRVAAARRPAGSCDVGACALELIGADGAPLGRRFGELADASAAGLAQLLPRANVFGLSNSTYRADVLRACLPLPSSCVAADWYLATAAWLRGARLGLDPAAHMFYRQHGNNIAPVMAPFTAATVRSATNVVRAHQQNVREQLSEIAGDNGPALVAARRVLAAFMRIVVDDAALAAYVAALNELPSPQAWWRIVAHPDLEDLWRT